MQEVIDKSIHKKIAAISTSNKQHEESKYTTCNIKLDTNEHIVICLTDTKYHIHATYKGYKSRRYYTHPYWAAKDEIVECVINLKKRGKRLVSP